MVFLITYNNCSIFCLNDVRAENTHIRVTIPVSLENFSSSQNITSYRRFWQTKWGAISLWCDWAEKGRKLREDEMWDGEGRAVWWEGLTTETYPTDWWERLRGCDQQLQTPSEESILRTSWPALLRVLRTLCMSSSAVVVILFHS